MNNPHLSAAVPRPTRRCAALAALLPQYGLDGLLLHDNASLFYATGMVFVGFCLITANGDVRLLVRRPVRLAEPYITYFRKVEQLPDLLGSTLPRRLGVALDSISVADYRRLCAALPAVELADATALLRQARSVKDDEELALVRESGRHHVAAYARIPALYREGITDVEFQVALERTLRLEGCLGLFRMHGPSMEMFMGSVLTGANADTPSPYDFAMGGAGQHPSLPVGANGMPLRHGHPVMVDACGNFTGYMTDMTRVYSVGPLSDSLAWRAHDCSRRIHRRFAEMCRPGVAASALYDMAARMAADEGLADYFMGHRQQAPFVGHGVGIEVNEAPVLSARSRDVMAAGNVVALEPKFVVPGMGAVGVENTYHVSADGVECLTLAPEEIIDLTV